MCPLWGVLCSRLQPGEILPGLPESDHPQAGRRAHEETTFPCYALDAEKALYFKAFRAQYRRGVRCLYLLPPKWHSICPQTHIKRGAVATRWLPCPVLFLLFQSFVHFFREHCKSWRSMIFTIIPAIDFPMPNDL